MFEILNVVAPVFILIALGYGAVRVGFYPETGVGGLIAYVNLLAAPCLLFRAMLTVDIGAAFDIAIIGPFYLGAATMIVLGTFFARRFFGRMPGEAVAVGFAAMFSNLVLVGVPVLQRAYGAEAMPVVYSIIGLHSPLLITGGTLLMEFSRRDGGKASTAVLRGFAQVAANPLLIGILFGVIGNLFGVRLTGLADEVTAMVASTVMPVALFGLGGALVAYRIADQWAPAAMASALKLFVQPAIAWVIMVPVLGVPPDIARYGVLLAAMPTGINAYIFATRYERSVDVASNTILLSTLGAVFSITVWLLILG